MLRTSLVQVAASLAAEDTLVVVHWVVVVAVGVVVVVVVEGTTNLVALVVNTVETLDIFPLSYARLDKAYFITEKR